MLPVGLVYDGTTSVSCPAGALEAQGYSLDELEIMQLEDATFVAQRCPNTWTWMSDFTVTFTTNESVGPVGGCLVPYTAIEPHRGARPGYRETELFLSGVFDVTFGYSGAYTAGVLNLPGARRG